MRKREIEVPFFVEHTKKIVETLEHVMFYQVTKFFNKTISPPHSFDVVLKMMLWQ